MGRNHDGGGHEALHHIPGDDYRKARSTCAHVTDPQWKDAARSFFTMSEANWSRFGGAEAFERADAA